MYESEPEPFMGGRRIYHARGKVLGGSSAASTARSSSAATRSTTSAGPPTRAWRPGTTPTACRTSSGWRRAWRPLPTTRGAVTTVRSCWSAGPATNPLFDGLLRRHRRGRLPAHGRRQRLSPGGLRAVRPEHPRGRRLSAARAYLHPIMAPATQPHGADLDARHPGCTSTATRAIGRGDRAARRRHRDDRRW